MKKRSIKFAIVVNPLGSLFGKTLQGSLINKVKAKVLRSRQTKPGRNEFVVTPRSLNKVEQFERFKLANVSSPRYCLVSSEINQLGSSTVFARKLINSTNGKGIVEFQVDRSGAAVYPAAPLYTEYIPKKAEYRYHVFGGQVIDVQEKRKRRDFQDERNSRVRNMHTGYVYCRDGLTPPNGAADLAIRATAACGYQYGAVDIIYNEKRNQCYVLEVNSRPGLSGTTLDKYTDAIINTFNLERK